MATYTGIKKIKIGDNIFELAIPVEGGQVFYGTIGDYTTASTVRTYTIENSNFNLTVGNIIVFTWEYQSNVVATANISLNVNNTGAKELYDYSGTKRMTFLALNTGYTYTYAAIYDGTKYILLNITGIYTTVINTDTSYYLLGSPGDIIYTQDVPRKHGSASIHVTGNSTQGHTQLRLGNETAISSNGGKEGQIRLYGTTATYYVDLKGGAPSANRTITFPNATGTVALTSDIPTTLPASDVYSWAKASTKPTYTASEVGALASDTTYVSKVTTTAGAHTAISNQSGTVSFNVPTKTSHLTNDSGFITSHNTYTVSSSGSGNAVTAISLSGTTFTVTKGSTFLTSHQDISGKFDKSGGTITGATTINNILTLYRESTTANNYPAGITFTNKDTTTGKSSDSRIYVYNDHANPSNGNNMVISPGGNLFLGSGEAPANHYNLYTNSGTENVFLTADNDLFLQVYGGTIADRKGVRILYNPTDENLFLLPCSADTATTDIGYLGGPNYRWKCVYANKAAIGPFAANTSQTAESQIICQGGAGKIYMYSHADKTGTVGIYWFPASGTGGGGILNVNQSGTLTLKGNTVVNGAFTANGNIIANGHSSAIGTIKDAYLTANKTVANNTGTSLCSFSLEAGVWVVHAWLRFPSNATGSRVGNIGSSGAADWQASMTAVNGNVSQLHFTRILNPTSTTTYHLNAIQTSGANMTLLAGATNGFNAMRAVRIQ